MRNNATAIAMLRKLTRSIHFVTFSLKWLCLWEYVSTSESVSMPYITRLRISKFCQPIMSTKNVKQIMMMRKRSRLGFSGFAAGSFGGAILRCIFLYCLAMDKSPIFLVIKTKYRFYYTIFSKPSKDGHCLWKFVRLLCNIDREIYKKISFL